MRTTSPGCAAREIGDDVALVVRARVEGVAHVERELHRSLGEQAPQQQRVLLRDRDHRQRAARIEAEGRRVDHATRLVGRDQHRGGAGRGEPAGQAARITKDGSTPTLRGSTRTAAPRTPVGRQGRSKEAGEPRSTSGAGDPPGRARNPRVRPDDDRPNGLERTVIRPIAGPACPARLQRGTPRSGHSRSRPS